ncbi:MAG: 10 kDa chaperonin [candidate division TM6 bacterium GW2011_GWF2_32_72]|nr:MAG: 10 kDa chaperonin [candidate division TM6 bacterium GW2011_GWF2_32_72]
MDYSKIRPLYDKILVKRFEGNESKTASGIIIPDTAKEKAQTAKVVATGEGRLDISSGKIIPLKIKVGDVVFLSKYAGAEAGDNYIIVREDEVIGIVEK